MKTTTDPRVDAYIEKSAAFAKPILKHLRRLVHRAQPAASEAIKWGMPSFIYQGSILCGMAAFKAHCTFGFWHQGMSKAIGAAGKKAAEAMGSLGRITSIDELPSDADLGGYIQHASKLIDAGAPARPKPKPKKALSVPADLAAGLKRSAAAKRRFAEFTPGKLREYIEWIVEAKRPETRAKRLASTLEWVAEGKSRNWKYENC
jgi:uncharacterized protein YdeI (YjbR/CyaY-like superfamily)